jgi:hypothetical protein
MGLGEEATFIYCTSLQTSLSPVTLALLHCFIVAMLVVKLHIFRTGKGKLASSPLKQFSHRYGYVLSIHDEVSIL